MARPPSGTDLKLKAAGRRLLREKGITGLSVREACRVAGVNTGMFHYYFGSKEEFLHVIMKEIYADFMLNFKAGVSAAKDPRAGLRSALVEVGKFVRELRRTLPMLFADVAHGRKEAFNFIRGNFTEHVSHIAALAERCRCGSSVKAHSMPFMVASLLPVMVFPAVMGGLLERNGVKKLGGFDLEELRKEILSDAAIEERAEIALRGIGL
jgi:AcrR family transcriptional regulator